MTETPTLREKQVEQLSFYISNKKCLDLSDPGTGKTPPCCVMAYYVHSREDKSTVWSQPKSLMQKNRREMLRFTDFEPHQVRVMKNDRANLTKNWKGPTLTSTRKVATWELEDGTSTHELRKDGWKTYWYWDEEESLYRRLGRKITSKDHPTSGRVVKPKLGPDDQPIRDWHYEPETFKDLIAAAVDDGVRVFICTFAFLSAHWERMIEAQPDIDFLLVDELHMGYGGLESAQTESFYHMNNHCSRFVGMTGTLINGRWDSAFPAIHVIEPTYYGTYLGFVYDHCAVMDDYGRIKVWKNGDKLRAILKRHSIARTFEEVYGKEPVVFLTENMEIDEDMRASYEEFHRAAILELQDESIIDGSNPGVAVIRARQIINHPQTMLKGYENKLTPKDERVQVHLAEGHKTIIFASLVPEQERMKKLAEDMGLRVGMINAKASVKERDRIDQAAQNDELDVIVASGPTVAVGYNWEMFDLVIFASVDYMDTNVTQGYRRASRGTRTYDLRVIFLRYVETVDEEVYGIVHKKSVSANEVDENRPVFYFED